MSDGMSDGIVKIGYARVVGNETGYLNYQEFKNYSEQLKESLYQRVLNGDIRLFCACCQENTLPLIMSRNFVIRVAENGKQEEHKISCPKSIHYNSYLSALDEGKQTNEEGDFALTIAMPSIFPSEKAESVFYSFGPEKEKENEEKEGRLNFAGFLAMLNKYAWEKQFFIKKWEMRKQNTETATYYSHKSFTKFMLNHSKKHIIRNGSSSFYFKDLLYEKENYKNCTDFKQRWFIYACIDKISDFKADRKYQYITLWMPGPRSEYKSSVRIRTELFLKLMEQYEPIEDERCHAYLAGYIHKSIFKENEWMTFIGGNIVQVNPYGVICNDSVEYALCTYLCDNGILYKMPYTPIENYGNETPFIVIEKNNDKNIIIDLAQSTRSLNKKQQMAAENPEFDIFVLKNDTELDKSAILNAINI